MTSKWKVNVRRVPKHILRFLSVRRNEPPGPESLAAAGDGAGGADDHAVQGIKLCPRTIKSRASVRPRKRKFRATRTAEGLLRQKAESGRAGREPGVQIELVGVDNEVEDAVEVLPVRISRTTEEVASLVQFDVTFCPDPNGERVPRPVCVIQIGKQSMKTSSCPLLPPDRWEYMPKLFVCQACLEHRYGEGLEDHCRSLAPPGRLVYTDGPDGRNKYGVYEVMGEENQKFCANIFFLAKLFSGHAPADWSVSDYVFYVLHCRDESLRLNFIGYFLKDKRSRYRFTVSSIFVLPDYPWAEQLLICLVYHFAKAAKVVCHIEMPLSGSLGAKFQSYWSKYLQSKFPNLQQGSLSDFPYSPELVEELVTSTSIARESVLFTLERIMNGVNLANDEHF